MKDCCSPLNSIFLTLLPSFSLSNLPIEGFNIFVNSPLYVFVWLFFLEIKQPLPLLLVKRRRFAPGAPLEHAFAIDKAPKMESPQNCVTAKQFNSALVALLNGGHCMGSRKLEWAAYCEAGRPIVLTVGVSYVQGGCV